MRKAFTMIEIIFVIVIIGLLAAVAIPKMVANIDDATASLCANEVGQLIHEVGNTYTKVGYTDFINLTISDMSNIGTSIVGNDNGIIESSSTTLDTVGVTYNCGGEAVVKIVCNLQGGDYNISIEDRNPVSPAGINAIEKLIEQNIVIASGVRNYKL